MEKILIACDHAAVSFKESLIAYLSTLNQFEVIDLGTHSDKSVDYPDFAHELCQRILKGEAKRGILTCGSGQGMAMSANKHKGIRAALCWDIPSAELSRRHNNSNVLCMGARLIPLGLAQQIVHTWLTTAFDGGRHEGRVQKIDC